MIDIKNCNGKKFYLKNRWGPESERRHGKYMGDYNNTSIFLTGVNPAPGFIDENKPEYYVPWEFKKVNNTDNQYYLIDRRVGSLTYGKYLIFNKNSYLSFADSDDTVNRVPWEFKLRGGGNIDQFYLVNRWKPGDHRYGKIVAFNKNDQFRLYDVNDTYDHVPFELMAVDQPKDIPEPDEILQESMVLPSLNDSFDTNQDLRFIQHVRTVHIPSSEMKDLYLQQKCPYYVLKTSVGWFGGSAHTNNRAEETIEYKLSVTRANSIEHITSVTDTFTESIKVTGSSGIDIDGFSAGIQVESSQQWTHETVSTETIKVDKAIEESEVTTINPGETVQIFLFTTREELFHPDGTKVWEIDLFSESSALADDVTKTENIT